MQLSYRQLEATLAAYMRVHPDRIGTFRSRLKQLQRLEFPSGVNIGRGVRMTYSAIHLLQLAVAFEFLGTGMPAKVATDLVIEHWPKFEAAFGRAYANLFVDEPDSTYVCIPAKSPVEPLEGWGDYASVDDSDSLFHFKFPVEKHGRAAYTVIDVSWLFNEIIRLAREVGQERDSGRSPEYEEWYQQRRKHLESFDFTTDSAPSSSKANPE